MPLVRLQVRNEYGLGQPELYKETNREDPKAVLDGVAVAGLVGILRQLGDLADFAAEVFHGLQEQVLTTASRSHKLMLRAQNIEASLPPLEKAILTQTSHIHFAYTAGCEWHCRTKTAQNHFIYNDLPQFIMDSYEECRDPPRLHLLDKFDSGGPGSCLRRYSDPTFFKRASAYSDEAYSEKIERARKTCRSKKKRLSQRKGGILLGEQMHSNSGRMQFASHVNGKTSSLQTASPVDMMPKSDPEDHSDSFDSKTGAGYIECVFHSRNSVQPDEQEYEESSSRMTQKTDTLLSASPALDDNFSHDSFDKQIASTSTGLTWHEKEEIMDSKMQPCDGDKTPDVLAENQNLHMHEDEAVIPEKNHHNDFLNGVESNLEPVYSRVQTDEIDSEPDRYLDALNDIESESENDLDCEIKQEVEQFTSHITGRIMENGVDGATSTVRDHDLPDVVYEILSGVSINEETERDFLDSLQEIPPLISESHVSSFMSPAPSDVPVNIERTKNIVDSHASESPIYEQVPHRCNSCVLDCSVGTNPLDGAHTLNKTVSGSIQTDISSGSRSSDLPDKEADRDFPESLQEIPPPISELNGPSLRSPVPSDVPVNIERTKNLADSHASESPIMEQVPHISENSVLDCSVGTNPLGSAHTLNDTASVSIETDISSGSRSSDLPDKEADRDFPESLLEIPPLISEPHGTSLRSPVSSDVPVKIERTKNLADSHASESPIMEQVPHISENSVLDCSVGTNPLGGAHTLNDTASVSIETDISSGSRSSDLPDKEADRDFPESLQEIPSLISDPHGTSLISPVSSDVPVNIERTKKLADSHASESPITEQVPHISGNSVLDCSVGTNPLGGAHTLNDIASVSIETDVSTGSRISDLPDKEADRHFPESLLEIPPLISEPHGTNLRSPVLSDVPVKIERTKNLADSHASESPITEQVPHISGNSVLDCSIGTNPLGGAHTLNDTVSVSFETDISSGSRISDLPDKEADRHFPESLLEIPPLISEPHGTSLRSPVSSDVPVKIERTKNLADSHTSESPITEHLPHISGNSVLDCSVGTNPLGGAHTLNDTVSVSIETDISSGSRSSDLPDKEADRINSNLCKFEETPSESAIDHSISLWTNGGLLGLEPSKPPDFIMSSSLTSINVTGGPSNHNSMLKSNGYEEEQDLSAEVAELKQEEPSSRCSTSHSDEQACISVKTSDCHHLRNGFGQKDEEDLDKIKVLAPGNALPVADNTRAACTEPNQGSRENSPLAFRLSHRSLINSFRRKVSFDEKSGPDNSLETGILELSGQNSIVHQSLPETPFKEQVSCGYTIDTPPPSPPLEHMKISFHPIIKVETSKLKLKFPDGSSYHESTRDVFPSFQLVPELFIPLHDSGSNSDDDDTFCRSSPYVSDDCLSPHSAYNSDQWESGDTSDSSYPGVYDSSHRISLTESKFSSQDIRGVTNVDINLDSGHSMYTQDSAEPSLYGPLLDFPSFDTMNFVLDKEYNKYSDYKNNLKLQSHAEPTPPPFPPKQWGESNLQLDMMNEMQNYISEDSGQINDPNILESTLQLRPSQVEQNKTDLEFYDDISCNLKDKLNQQNLNGQKKENQVGTGKDTDEREDFLQQIRIKSFNLRHAVTGKPSASTGPATNGKVTAILEKVNAIRQVVTSDDGEDDNWSDT